MSNKSKNKGRRGENLFIAELEKAGYEGSYRGQVARFSSGKNSADVECPDLTEIHFEVKNQERLNLWKSWEQAESDANHREKTPVLAVKKNNSKWLIVIDAAEYFRLLEKN